MIHRNASWNVSVRFAKKASRRFPHRNLLAIALANKLARITWAVPARGRDYQPRITTNVT
jgi:hypothetical protein